METVYTIRLTEEYVGMLEHIKLSLKERGIEEKDHILLRAVRRFMATNVIIGAWNTNNTSKL